MRLDKSVYFSVVGQHDNNKPESTVYSMCNKELHLIPVNLHEIIFFAPLVVISCFKTCSQATTEYTLDTVVEKNMLWQRKKEIKWVNESV